jgi:RNA polymerase sigma factor (sigma-70 family)
MGGHVGDAEEAFSRAGLRIYDKLGSAAPAGEAEVRAWLLRVTFNVCMDLHREIRRRREEALPPEAIPDDVEGARLGVASSSDPEMRYLENELHQALRRSIAGLPERLRETVVGYLSLASYREVARRLAISEVNARKRMQEARKLLRGRLEDYLKGGGPSPVSAGAPADHRPRPVPSQRVVAQRRVVARRRSEEEEIVALHGLPPDLTAAGRAALERYCRAHPRGWKKHLALARHALLSGDLESARGLLAQVVARRPRHLAAWIELAAAERLFGGAQAAAAVYARAAETLGEGPGSSLSAGLAAAAEGRHATAERLLQRAADEMPAVATPLVALTALGEGDGRYCEAAAAADAAVAADPADVAALTAGRRALRLTGRSGAAIRRIERALELDPGNDLARARWFEMRCRATGGAFADGSTEARHLRRLRSAVAPGVVERTGLACWSTCRGDLDAAEAELAGACRERPLSPAGWARLGSFLDWRGRAVEAAEAVARALELRPRDRSLDLQACRVLARAGRAAEVRRAVDALLARYGDAWDVASTAAWALLLTGSESERALELASRGLERQPRLPAAWVDHGFMLARGGRPREAVEALRAGWRLLPEGDGFDLAARAALLLARLHGSLGESRERRAWVRRCLDAAGACEGSDPLLARLWSGWAMAAPGAGGRPAGENRLFRRAPEPLGLAAVEERRALTFLPSEASWR